MLNAKSFVIGIKIEDHSPAALLVFYKINCVILNSGVDLEIWKLSTFE
jgi:hypothetical protein